MSNSTRNRSVHGILAAAVCRGLLLPALVVCLALPAALEAGSIFMKNGYIIQGPIVERSEGDIVLGWPNGKLLIHRRFVDSIVYEQAEEKRLAEDEAHHAKESQTTEDSPLLIESLGEVEDLPSDIDDIMRKYVINTKANTGVETGSTATDPSNGATGGEQGTATIVTRPDEFLGERVSDETLAVSFKPPKAWTTRLQAGVFEAAGVPGPDGFKPCINVTSLPKGPLGASDYAALLKEEDAKSLRDFEVLGEGPRDVGSEKAHEVVGRGVHNGHAANVRQIVVEKGGTLWLVSVFVSAQGGDSVTSQVDEALKTFEFVAR
jgi:hypothetical protein